MNELFSGPAQVSIQGERVLRLLDFTGNQAKYEVIGFEELPVVLLDSRKRGLMAIQELLENGDLRAFAPKFNHPANVRITEDDNTSVIIELTDTCEHPRHLLWIAIGLRDSLPVYQYVYENIAPLHTQNEYAYLALYQLMEIEEDGSSRDEESPASYFPSFSEYV